MDAPEQPPGRLVDRHPRVAPEQLLAEFVPPPRFTAERFSTYRPDPAQPSQASALQRLERQRIEIITGEPAREVDGGWLAEKLSRRVLDGGNFSGALGALARCGATLHPALAELAGRFTKAA